MTKQSIAQAVAAVQTAPGSLFTREDVVVVLNSIEAPKSVAITRAQIKSLTDQIYNVVRDNANNLRNEDVCDHDSAQFELDGNEIVLSGIDIDTDAIAEAVVEGMDDEIWTFFEELESKSQGEG